VFERDSIKMNNSIKYALIMFLFVLSMTIKVYAYEDITLKWHPNTEPDLAGYNVYYKIGTYGGEPYDGQDQIGYEGGLVDSPFDVGNRTEVTLTIPSEYTTDVYYFVVTAYNTEGYESGFSNEVKLDGSDNSSGGGGCFLGTIN
jgi:chitinase